MKRKSVYVVNFCNLWKEYSSFTLMGIFTTRKKLNVALNLALKNNEIEWQDEECDENKRKFKYVNKYSIEQLQNELNYVFIDIITLNEIQ